MLRIFLFDENYMKININADFTIAQLKAKIERQLELNGHEKIEAKNQRLIFRGQVLSQDSREVRTISGIKNGHIVHLVSRRRMSSSVQTGSQSGTDSLQTRALFGVLSMGLKYLYYKFEFMLFKNYFLKNMSTRTVDGKIRDTETLLRNMTESIQCAQREGDPRGRRYFNEPEEEPEVGDYKLGKLFGTSRT